MDTAQIIEKIEKLRFEVVVNAALYYKFNNNILSDNEFDVKVKTLCKLQDQYPAEAKQAKWNDEFMEWRDPECIGAQSTCDHPLLGADWVTAECERLCKEHHFPMD